MFNPTKILIPIILGTAVAGFTIDYINSPEAPVLKTASVNIDNPNNPITNIEYSSKIMDKNLLNVSGFEEGDKEISYEYSPDSMKPEYPNRRYGGQSKVITISSDGKYSTKINDTFSNSNVSKEKDFEGNFLGFQDFSIARFKDGHILPKDSYIAVNIDVLTDNNSGDIFKLAPIGQGEVTVDSPPLMQDSVPGGPFIYTRDAKPGDTRLYFTNVKSIKELVDKNKSRIWIADKETTKGDYTYCYIESYNPEEGYVDLKEPIKAHIYSGDFVRRHFNPGSINFKEKNIPENNDWQTMSFVASTSTMTNYNPSERPVNFRVKSTTNGIMYIDNIQFGYANKIKLFRNNELVYEGYDMEFEDTEAKDISKPDRIDNIQANIITNDESSNSIRIKFDTPKDNGTDYTYTAKASFDNNDSVLSKPIKTNILTGIEGYSYIIDNNPDSIPDETVDTTDTTISKDNINTSNNDWYVHIKSIDKAGNFSEVLHKKIELQSSELSTTNKDGDIVLNWEISDNNKDNYFYKVYRKKNNEDFIEVESNTKKLSYIDSNAIDVNSPDKPSIKTMNYNKENNLSEYIINTQDDIGTKYSYFIETYTLEGEKVSTSNISTIEVTSGIKEILYNIDSFEDINPSNVANKVENNSVSTEVDNSSKFLHLKSIDNNGNESAIFNIKVNDDILPELELRLTNYYPTNKSISIIVTAKDNLSIDYIVLPNSQRVYENNASYTINENGKYSFIAYDTSGNRTLSTINVDNIDKDIPIVTISKDPATEWANTDVNINIEGKDTI